MPKYVYKAKTEEGEKISGQMQAMDAVSYTHLIGGYCSFINRFSVGTIGKILA